MAKFFQCAIPPMAEPAVTKTPYLVLSKILEHYIGTVNYQLLYQSVASCFLASVFGNNL